MVAILGTSSIVHRNTKDMATFVSEAGLFKTTTFTAEGFFAVKSRNALSSVGSSHPGGVEFFCGGGLFLLMLLLFSANAYFSIR